MWELVLVLLVALSPTVVSAKEKSYPWPAPANLEFDIESAHTVSVRWKFPHPRLFSGLTPVFALKVWHSGNLLRIHSVSQRKRRLHFRLRGLKPATKYTVEVFVLMRPRRFGPLTRGAPALGSFTTWMDNWGTPVITNTRETDTGSGLHYRVDWFFSQTWEAPLRFELYWCSPDCMRVKTPPEGRNFVLPLNYYTNYSVQVTAIYDAPVIGRFSLHSVRISNVSSMAKPAKVERLTRFEQIGNQLRIEWDPTPAPNGPLSYYNVVVRDPLNPLIQSSARARTGISVNIRAPSVKGDYFEVVIIGVNFDRRQGLLQSDPTVFIMEKDLPLRVKDMEILKLETDRIIFKVIAFGSRKRYHVIDVVTNVNMTVLDAPAGVVELYNLEPYTAVPVSARVCTRMNDSASCGAFDHLTLVSNVAAPSAVPFLKIRQKDRDCYNVTWDRALEPNGPVDGYEFAWTSGESPKALKIRSAVVQERQYLFCVDDRYVDITQRIAVTAFNKDLMNRKILHHGKTTYQRFPGHSDPNLPFIIFIISMVLFSLGSVCMLMLLCMIPCSRKRLLRLHRRIFRKPSPFDLPREMASTAAGYAHPNDPNIDEIGPASATAHV